MRKMNIITIFFVVLLTFSKAKMDAAEFEGAKIDRLEQEIAELKEEIEHEMVNHEYDQPLGAARYECTGGVDPNKITVKEYMEKFEKGPCSPVVMLPGIGGSKMHVQIDCQVLKSSHPDIFSLCGWSTCSQGILDKYPKSEYKIWIPAPLTHFSIASKNGYSKK